MAFGFLKGGGTASASKRNVVSQVYGRNAHPLRLLKTEKHDNSRLKFARELKREREREREKCRDCAGIVGTGSRNLARRISTTFPVRGEVKIGTSWAKAAEKSK